jgi:hypothetical protein
LILKIFYLKNNIVDKISIVIPSLGNESLATTLNCIYLSNIIIYEVIIIIPYNFKINFNINKFNDKINIKIIYTEAIGQVLQRIEGFKLANGDYILQLDDDVEFNEFMIFELYNTLKLKGQACVSPLFVDKLNSKSVYLRSFCIYNKLFNILFYFNNKVNEGKIAKNGIPYGVITENKLIEADWLPGGCVLHLKKNLILFNYFPFKGKAYMEDLFHSYYLKKMNLQLIVNSYIKCLIINPESELVKKNIFKNKYYENKIRKKYFKLRKFNLFLFYWTCFIQYIISIIKYFKY